MCDQVVYTERATVNRMMPVEQIIGSRALLHITAVGKRMLGEWGEQGVARYARQTQLPRYTSNTITTLDILQEAVKEARAQGHGLDHEEAERGVGCIGVLVEYRQCFDRLGLSISVPIDRPFTDWAPLLQEAAEQLSRKLNTLPAQLNPGVSIHCPV